MVPMGMRMGMGMNLELGDGGRYIRVLKATLFSSELYRIGSIVKALAWPVCKQTELSNRL